MITHEVIIAIVSVELLFAFAVGIICIIFSFNLLRSIKEANGYEPMGLTHGNLSHSVRVPNTNASGLNGILQADLEGSASSPLPAESSHPARMLSQGSEMDFEGPLDPNNPNPNEGLIGIYNSFVSYIRLW